MKSNSHSRPAETPASVEQARQRIVAIALGEGDHKCCSSYSDDVGNKGYCDHCDWAQRCHEEKAEIERLFDEVVASLLAAPRQQTASPPAETKGWQPIETATRDNWWLHTHRAVGGWHHKTLGWVWGPLNYYADKHHKNGGYFIANGGEPTHWLALPGDPNDER